MPYIIERKVVDTMGNKDSNINQDIKYPMNDLGSVYTHYDKSSGKNIPTKNTIERIKEDDKTRS